MQSRMEESEKTNTELRAEIALLRNVGSVIGSPEASKVNTRRGAQNASVGSIESANTSVSSAADNAEQAPPAASVARTTTPAAETSRVGTATPKRAYAAIVTSGKSDASQPKRQTRKGENQKKVAQPALIAVRSSLPRTCSQVDEEGFTKVERKKKKPCSRNLCGTAPSGPNMLLRPAVPTTQLYLSRLHHSTTAEDVVQYVKVKTNWTLRVVRLESRHNVNFKSFVIRVPTQHLQTCLKEDFWPKGVVYRRFRGRLRDTTQRNTTPTMLRV